MWPALIIVAIAVVLIVLSLPRLRWGQPPEAPAPEPEPAGTVTAHIVTVQPSAVATGPFAYDNGLVIDGPDEGDEES
jgi:hypothetical protein